MAVLNGEWNPDQKVIDDIVKELASVHDVVRLRIEDLDGNVTLYSPNQLIDELKRGSEVGKRIYDYHLALLEIKN